MNIMITGPNGYVGSHLIKYFQDKGHTIFTLGRKIPAMPNAAHHQHFSLGDRINSSNFDHIDALIHTAYDLSLTKSSDIKAININGTIDLFQAAIDAKVKKIIYLSSQSAAKNAMSEYGAAKYQIEQFAKQHGIYSLRPGLIFSMNPGGLVGTMSNIIKKFPIIPLIGNGHFTLHLSHIDSLSELIDKLLASHTPIKDPIFAAHPQPFTFKKILQNIAKENRKRCLFIPIPWRLIYLTLKFAELIKLPLKIRSDSLRSLKTNYADDKSIMLESMNINWQLPLNQSIDRHKDI